MHQLWKGVAVAGPLLALAHLVTGGPRGESMHLLAAAVVLGIVVAALALHRVPHRAPWVLLAGGLVSRLAGDVVQTWVGVVPGTAPSPSAAAADLFHLAAYPLLAAGLAVLVRRRTGGAVQRASLLDAAVLTTGPGLVTWVYLVVPGVRGATGTLDQVVATAYPVLDLVLLGTAIRLLLTVDGRSVSSRSLGAAMITLVGSDVGYAAFGIHGLAWGEPAEIGYLLSCTLLAVAALHPSVAAIDRTARETAPTLTRARLVALAGACLLAPGVQLATSTTGADGRLVATALASAALFGLVVVRLSGLADQVQAQAHELDTLAVTDPLTGAANRRGFAERAASLTARPGEPLVLAVLDLDHFTSYNDWHGHAAGDELLQACVRVWAEQIRGRDHLARWGGEEFAVLLDRCGPDQAIAVVDRLRRSVPQDVTCSAGLAVWDGAESVDALLERAEGALYRAKAEGRDRTVLAADIPAVGPAVQVADAAR